MASSIAIHESKNSDKVVKFISAERPSGLYYQLLEHVSASTARRIIKAVENNLIWGLYYTKTGKVRAQYI